MTAHPYRVLVTGSRAWRGHAIIYAALDAYLAEHPDMKDPAVYERGAEEAREALANRPPGPYRPNPGDTNA